MEQKYIVAIEVGSSKVRGAIGAVDESGILTVKAIEEERLIDAVRYGCVRNVADVAESIRSIIKRLEAREAPRRVSGVYVAIGGKSTVLSTCHVERRLPVETEFTIQHVRQISEEARATVLNDRDILAVTPREFLIDNSRVNNPVGTFGKVIDATYNLVSGRSQLRRNLNHALKKALDLDVKDYCVRQLAQADTVLTGDEKRLGCMLVDFGAETTTVSIYKDGVLRYLATLPMGSRNITRDITSLNYLEENAERMKKTVCYASPGTSSDPFTEGGRDYTDVNALVAARAGEIIANINEQLKNASMTARDLPAGVVVVGGGAKLKGFNQRLESVTKMKVRTGLPNSAIRIVDNRIQPGDAIDVISILAEVSGRASECMYTPEPVPTVGTIGSEEEPDVDETEEIEDDEFVDETIVTTPKKRSHRVSRVKDWLTNLISENDDDDELKDD